MPRLTDASNKRGIIASAKPRYIAEGLNEHFGHLSSAVISGCEVEFPDSIPLDRRFFQFIEPDFLVFRKDYPAILSDEGQPFCVFGSGAEVSSMALVSDAVLDESVEDGLAVMKIFVEV
jgi:hypothetical protein